MKKIYYLDLDTLLTYLRNKSGTLTTSFQASGRSCMGTIFLVHGQITSCVAEWSNSQHFEGNKALDQLRSSREWQVHFDDVSPSSTLIPPPQFQSQVFSVSSVLTDGSFVPQPISSLFLSLLLDYNAEQREILRMVYTLVDGYHTIDQIKAQLKLSPGTVDRALDVLCKLGVIR